MGRALGTGDIEVWAIMLGGKDGARKQERRPGYYELVLAARRVRGLGAGRKA